MAVNPLNLEPIRQRLSDRRNGAWTIPQPNKEGNIGYRYCDPRPSDSEMLDDGDDMVKEIERLRLENDRLRAEVAALKDENEELRNEV